MALKGSNNDSLNVMDAFNPLTKITLTRQCASSPSMVSYLGTMRIAWKGPDGDILHLMNVYPFPGSEPHHVANLPETSPSSPASTQFSLAIICWTGSGNLKLNHA